MSHFLKSLLVVFLLLGLGVAWTLKLSSERDSNSGQLSGDYFSEDSPSESLDSQVAPSLNSADTTEDEFFECEVEFEVPNQDLDEVASLLSKSENPEHLLIGMLYGPSWDDEASVAVAMKALEKAPNDRLILWSLVNSCAQYPQAKACSGTAIEDRAIAVDGSNGQMWARISALRAKRGDMAGALDALTQATAAPRFSDYRMEHIELFERGLAAVGNSPYRQRIIQAIGMEAAMVSLETSMVHECYRQGTESYEWRQLCLRYGERLENDGRDLLPVVNGQGLQVRMHSISGDTELAASAEARQKLLLDMSSSMPRDMEILLAYDDQVLASYISNLAVYGETEAVAYLSEDVERLRGQAGYDPCDLRK